MYFTAKNVASKVITCFCMHFIGNVIYLKFSLCAINAVAYKLNGENVNIMLEFPSLSDSHYMLLYMTVLISSCNRSLGNPLKAIRSRSNHLYCQSDYYMHQVFKHHLTVKYLYNTKIILN